MVELKTKITTTGVLYIPKELRESFGRNMKIIPNTVAALFFPAGTSYENVLKSLRIIEADVQHRIDMQAEKTVEA